MMIVELDRFALAKVIEVTGPKRSCGEHAARDSVATR
jgi:hypothetical protein